MKQEEFFYQCMDIIEYWLNGNRKLSDLREVTDKLYNEVTKPNWISVEDRKPKLKRNNDYFQYSEAVTVTDGEYCISANWVHSMAGWYGWFNGDEELKGITHWMPMPSVEHLKNR